ncbi:MAG: nuclear transport factor 2 family protein [Akkermansiaceae bacterium]|nr:nuclear transport factor 2 family protein [Verrucomicrobiales bacterium]
MDLPSEDITHWLRSFSTAVRDQDFKAGKLLFDGRVVSFGTVCVRAENLDELESHQWRSVWPNTRDFEFDYTATRVLVEAGQTVVLTHWSSTGLTGDDQPFQRRGRATLVLRKDASQWKAIHTHFSIEPMSKHDPLFRQGA